MAIGKRRPETLHASLNRALERGAMLQADGCTAQSARYDARTERLIVELSSGIAIAIPVRLIQGLAGGTGPDRRDVHIAGGGVALHWPRLDVDLSVRNLVAGLFGNRQWMSELARHAGSRTSAAKARAARENGKKGGRPRTSSTGAAPGAT